MNTVDQAVVFDVYIEEGESGLLFATSPQEESLFVTEHDLPALLEEIPRVLESIYAARGEKITVISARYTRKRKPPARSYVAIPAHIAASQLSQAEC